MVAPVTNIFKQFLTENIKGVEVVNTPMARGHYTIRLDGKEIGTAGLSRERKFLSFVMLEREYQRRGVGTIVYDKIEEDIGRPLVPSPLGLSREATEFWKKRLRKMPRRKAKMLLAESWKLGADYRIPLPHMKNRLWPLYRAIGIDV